MAQTGYTPISIYYSSTSTNVPTAGNLVAGELAINTADGKLFYKDSAGVVQVIGTKGGVGSSTTTQVLYNSSGLVVGSANMTFNGTTLTLANDASISGLTVGKGGGAVASNTAVGVSALNANTTGDSATALGYQALYSNTTGTGLTAIGRNALYKNTTGYANIAIGGYDSNSGNNGALFNNTTGSANTAVGSGALLSNTTGSANTAVGYQAGYSYNSGSANGITALGYQALYSTTTDSATAVGTKAAYSTTTGYYVVAMGREALYSNTSGTQNVAIGDSALRANTTASYNTAVGYQGLYANTTGTQNTAMGFATLKSCTTAQNNAAFGDQALQASTTASSNTAVGSLAGYNITTGSNNTCVGYNAGSNGVAFNGSYSVYVGFQATPSGTGVSSEYVLGTLTGKGSNTFSVGGSSGAYNQANSATWSITSDARLKKNIVNNNTGLDLINQIQVRNFEYRLPEEITELEPTCAIERKGTQLGVIAQEIAQVSQEFVKTESTGVMSVDTDNLVWYLINAVKELNAKITALENK